MDEPQEIVRLLQQWQAYETIKLNVAQAINDVIVGWHRDREELRRLRERRDQGNVMLGDPPTARQPDN